MTVPVSIPHPASNTSQKKGSRCWRVQPHDTWAVQRASECFFEAFSQAPTWQWAYVDPAVARAKIASYLVPGLEVGEVWLCGRGDYDGDASAKAYAESAMVLTAPGVSLSSAPSYPACIAAYHAVLPAPLHDNPPASEPDIDHIRQTSWTVDLIGTCPSGAGRGLGVALLREAQARGGGVCVMATHEPNVAYYEKLGFRLIETKAYVSHVGPKVEHQLYCP